MGIKLRTFDLSANRGRGPDAERLLAILTDLQQSGEPIYLSALIVKIGSVNRKPGVLSGSLRAFACSHGLRFSTRRYVREKKSGVEVEDLKLWVLLR